jgi:hypothetical protein
MKKKTNILINLTHKIINQKIFINSNISILTLNKISNLSIYISKNQKNLISKFTQISNKNINIKFPLYWHNFNNFNDYCNYTNKIIYYEIFFVKYKNIYIYPNNKLLYFFDSTLIYKKFINLLITHFIKLLIFFNLNK